MIAPLPRGAKAGDTFVVTPYTVAGHCVVRSVAGVLVFRYIIPICLTLWAAKHEVYLMTPGGTPWQR